MIKLIKAIIDWLNHKSDSLAGTVNKLVTAEERINKLKGQIIDQLERQKKDALDLFVEQEEFKDNLDKISKSLDKYHKEAREIKGKLNENPEDTRLESRLKIVATQYLETKSLYDDMKSQEGIIDANVKRVEDNLRNLNVNKAIVEAKAETLTMKVKLYRSMKSISNNGVIEVNHIFAEVEELVKKTKHELEAENKVKELVEEDTPKPYTDTDLDSFIKTL